MVIELKLLLLLVIANGAPIIMRYLLKDCCNWPIDGGLKTQQGQPLLGHSKTLRGVVAAVVLSTAIAPILGISWYWGTTLGAFAMLGDIVTSFIKRRLGYAPSSQAFGLDQIPESLLPLLAVTPAFQLTFWSIFTVTLAFCVVVPLLSLLFYLLGIRQHPY
jgi:CDP-2,3-bis-(O-geranylgeranyl)-sn-glycerol synthase